MEVLNAQRTDNSCIVPSSKDFLQISCNWQISNNKQFHEAVTTVTSNRSPAKTHFEDVVSFGTCISLEPFQFNNEPCMLDIKVTNHQRISCIAIVSEAYLLEFFKQHGEYAGTKSAEFIDEFEGSIVYFTETAITPFTTEASIKFTKTTRKNSTMWIYGIKLYLTEPIEPKHGSMDFFNPELLQKYLSTLNFKTDGTNAVKNSDLLYNILNSSKCEKNETDGTSSNNENNILNINDAATNIDNKFRDFETRLMKKIGENEQKHEMMAKQLETCRNFNITDITNYIDNKFHDMETRIMKKIDESEQRTNKKLDSILQLLETIKLNS